MGDLQPDDDDRAVGWTSLVASMSAAQVRLHFILYREWAYALGGLEDEEQKDAIASGQHAGEMYVDFDPVVRALLGDDLEEDLSADEALGFATQAVAGLARLNLVASVVWHVGASSKLPEPRPDLPFDSMIHVIPSWPGIELFGWACGLPGYSFREFIALPEVPECCASLILHMVASLPVRPVWGEIAPLGRLMAGLGGRGVAVMVRVSWRSGGRGWFR